MANETEKLHLPEVIHLGVVEIKFEFRQPDSETGLLITIPSCLIYVLEYI